MKFYKILFASLMLAGCSALSATTPLNYYNYMETALGILIMAAQLILSLTLLVFIHELGHFLAAKFFDAKTLAA